MLPSERKRKVHCAAAKPIWRLPRELPAWGVGFGTLPQGRSSTGRRKTIGYGTWNSPYRLKRQWNEFTRRTGLLTAKLLKGQFARRRTLNWISDLFTAMDR